MINGAFISSTKQVRNESQHTYLIYYYALGGLNQKAIEGQKKIINGYEGG